jgi:hypothetical protein
VVGGVGIQPLFQCSRSKAQSLSASRQFNGFKIQIFYGLRT